MRVHRIRLAHYRGVIASEVAFADTGVTIVEGPNEVGKSSLAEAMSLVIEELDTSAKERVRAVRPVDRDEGTEVELELSTGPYRFVIRKRWFKGKGIWLDVLAPSRLQLTGRDAHDRMHAMIGETADRALWDALRLDQGREATQSVLATRSVLKALDAVAGGLPDDASDGADLWQRIEQEWSTYFTPTGQPKGERKHLEALVASTAADLHRLDAELEALEAKTDRVAAISQQLHQLHRDHLAAEQRCADLDDEWRTLAGAAATVETLALTRRTAELERDRCRDAVDRRASLAAEVVALAAQRAELEAGEAAGARVADEHERQRQAAEQAVDAARSALVAAEADHARITADLEHARRILDHSLLSERYARVVANSARLVALHEILDAAIDPELAEEIAAAEAEVVRCRTVLEAAAGSFAVEALGALTVDVAGTPRALAVGEVLTRPLTDACVIEIPGVARFSVVPDAGARSGAARLADAEAALAARCAAAGVIDAAAATAACRAQELAGRDREVVEEQLRNDLRDLTPEVMAAKIHTLDAQMAAFVASRPATTALPATLEEGEALAAESTAIVAACRAAVDEAVAVATGLAAAGQGRVAEAAQRVARLGAVVEAAERAAAELTAARDHRPDAALQADCDAAEARLDAAVAAHDAAATELAAHDPDSVKARLDNARDRLDRLVAERSQLELERTEVQAFLKGRGEDGLHQQRSEALASLERASRDLERDTRHAAAADLLHRTFANRREAARQRYVAPLRSRIERLGRIVYGPSFEVELDAELRVARRTLNGVSLDVKDLSAGAKEQLAILSRLACAATVSADGGAPVIFDDTMGWTDDARQAAMGAAIAAAGRECQVIILTCVPARFASVGNATTHRLHVASAHDHR